MKIHWGTPGFADCSRVGATTLDVDAVTCLNCSYSIDNLGGEPSDEPSSFEPLFDGNRDAAAARHALEILTRAEVQRDDPDPIEVGSDERLEFRVWAWEFMHGRDMNDREWWNANHRRLYRGEHEQ